MANNSTLHISSILSTSARKRTNKVVGYQTPQGKVYCPECANKRGAVASAVETYRASDTSDWTIVCESCEETILEAEDL